MKRPRLFLIPVFATCLALLLSGALLTSKAMAAAVYWGDVLPTLEEVHLQRLKNVTGEMSKTVPKLLRVEDAFLALDRDLDLGSKDEEHLFAVRAAQRGVLKEVREDLKILAKYTDIFQAKNRSLLLANNIP